MPLRIVFMGTPDFAVPTLEEIVGAGHEVVAVYAQPPRAAGRGMAERKSPVQAFAEAAGIPVLTPLSFKAEADKATFAAHAADAAVVVAYGLLLPAAVLDGAALRLLQRASFEAAALARCRADPARHHGGRYRDRRDGDAHGGGARHGARLPRRAGADRRRRDGGRAARRPGAARRVADGARAGGARARLARLHAASRRRASPTPRRSTRRRPASTSPQMRARCTTSSAACRRFPAHGSRPAPTASASASRCCAPSSPTGSGAPGAVLDDQLTIACGAGAVRLVELQRAGKKPMSAGEFLRGFPLPRGTRLGFSG